MIVDQKGYKYRNCMQNYEASEKFSTFECDKKYSQDCKGQISCDNETGRRGLLMKKHSCRWSYEEAVNYCYTVYHGNPNIKTGYHPPIASFDEAWRLLWSIHFETFNIWSHLVGVILHLYFLLESLMNIDAYDYWITIFYNFLTLAMFTQSTLYHWMHIGSVKWHNRLLCSDNCGISFYTFAIHIRWMFYGLPHNFQLFNIYFTWQVIVLVSGLVCCYKCVYAKDNVKLNELAKISLLALHQILVYVLHVHQQWIRNELSNLFLFDCCVFLLPSIVSTFLAMIFYVKQYPESIWPGYFDTYLNSHQIMHIFILVASIFQRYFFNCLRVI